MVQTTTEIEEVKRILGNHAERVFDGSGYNGSHGSICVSLQSGFIGNEDVEKLNESGYGIYAVHSDTNEIRVYLQKVVIPTKRIETRNGNNIPTSKDPIDLTLNDLDFSNVPNYGIEIFEEDRSVNIKIPFGSSSSAVSVIRQIMRQE